MESWDACCSNSGFEIGGRGIKGRERSTPWKAGQLCVLANSVVFKIKSEEESEKLRFLKLYEKVPETGRVTSLLSHQGLNTPGVYSGRPLHVPTSRVSRSGGRGWACPFEGRGRRSPCISAPSPALPAHFPFSPVCPAGATSRAVTRRERRSPQADRRLGTMPAPRRAPSPPPAVGRPTGRRV